MRFRSKFGLYGWWFAVMFLIFNLPWILGGKLSIADKALAIATGVCLLGQLLARYFVYWELDETLIREHRFWKDKSVPYSAILGVGTHAYWRQRPTALKITYSRANESSNEGRMYATPADVQGFIDALHRFAPSTAAEV